MTATMVGILLREYTVLPAWRLKETLETLPPGAAEALEDVNFYIKDEYVECFTVGVITRALSKLGNDVPYAVIMPQVITLYNEIYLKLVTAGDYEAAVLAAEHLSRYCEESAARLKNKLSQAEKDGAVLADRMALVEEQTRFTILSLQTEKNLVDQYIHLKDHTRAEKMIDSILERYEQVDVMIKPYGDAFKRRDFSSIDNRYRADLYHGMLMLCFLDPAARRLTIWLSAQAEAKRGSGKYFEAAVAFKKTADLFDDINTGQGALLSEEKEPSPSSRGSDC